MQNPITNFRQSFRISEKRGYLSENFDKLRLYTIGFNISFAKILRSFSA